MDHITSNPYVMIPNIVVQNIYDEKSYIQLFGKRTVGYLKQLIELKNINGNIYFTTNMILSMLDIQKNITRERSYFKEFLIKFEQNSLITIINGVDLETLRSSEPIVANLNIHEYNKDGKTINYFTLQNSEYYTILNYKGRLDKFNLLNLFCNLKSRMWKNPNDVTLDQIKPEVAYPSYETIKADIFIESDKTLKKYIDTLVELDLIRYDYAGDMAFPNDGQNPIRKKANFTYTLYKPGWESELKESIVDYRKKKIKDGWTFLTDEQELSADMKRSITQKINILHKKLEENKLTQSEKKELKKLERQQAKWKAEYADEEETRYLEEEKLKSENPGRKLSEIYFEMGYIEKAHRATWEEELEEGDQNDTGFECGEDITESESVTPDMASNSVNTQENKANSGDIQYTDTYVHPQNIKDQVQIEKGEELDKSPKKDDLFENPFGIDSSPKPKSQSPFNNDNLASSPFSYLYEENPNDPYKTKIVNMGYVGR